MEINQHNYEHYFLMYIDNELSGEEMAAVNNFIMQYPNYANKLEALQQLKISPATLIYENKFSLYKLSEQDEQCITYLENEMTNEEKASFESEISTDIYLQTTVKQWQATFITPPTTIEIAPNFKNSLFKNSAQIKPLWATVTFKRWASVAAILLVVIGYKLFNAENKQEKPSFTNNNGVKTELNNTAAVIERINGTDINATKKSIAFNKIRKETLLPIVYKSAQAQNENANSNLNSLSNTSFDAPNNDAAIALLAKEDINTKTIDETITLTKEIRPTSISNVIEEAKNNFEAITPTQVQYSNIDTDEEDRIINIANLEIDGAKFRELSRKITTLFKRTKPENDKYK
jgi:hypothetical protein